MTVVNIPLSRRDFLKLSGAGLLGAFLAELHLDRAFADSSAPPAQGRIAVFGNLYDDPSFNAKSTFIYGKDAVVNITDILDGDEGNPYNKTWYQLDGNGYIYSGWVQPVETNYQKPVFEIPVTGQLGEIAVPFSGTRRTPSLLESPGYRLYFATTHWVTGVSVNTYEKGVWYKIYETLHQTTVYIPASDMRLVPDSELTPLSPDVSDDHKHIYVDLSTQSVTAFEDDKAVLVARCSSGGKGTSTPIGKFQTFHKGPTIHMTNDGAADAGHGYDLPGVPWVSFFTGTGDSFHGTYWHNDYGKPRSHGCINLTPADAKFIYRWTSPVVPPATPYLYKPGEGTHVEIVSSSS
jgi:lipoprotein-anchoring transpeptidase ErfK/SrfK